MHILEIASNKINIVHLSQGMASNKITFVTKRGNWELRNVCCETKRWDTDTFKILAF